MAFDNTQTEPDYEDPIEPDWEVLIQQLRYAHRWIGRYGVPFGGNDHADIPAFALCDLTVYLLEQCLAEDGHEDVEEIAATLCYGLAFIAASWTDYINDPKLRMRFQMLVKSLDRTRDHCHRVTSQQHSEGVS